MHLIVEAYRRAYMDRGDYLGDPDFVKIPVEQLSTRNMLRLGGPASRRTRPPRRPPCAVLRDSCRLRQRRDAKSAEHNNTTHYSVVDADGNAVSVTTTLNNSFGSAATAGGSRLSAE